MSVCQFAFTQTVLFSDSFAMDFTYAQIHGMPTKKIYRVTTEANGFGRDTIYKVNKKKVSKQIYDKYHEPMKNIKTCTPCILEVYDIKDRLLEKAVRYTDCIVGPRLVYYPNIRFRSVKLNEQYKENKTNDWSIDLYNSGLCSVKHGWFVYYNRKGDILRTEEWEDGVLAKTHYLKKNGVLITIDYWGKR